MKHYEQFMTKYFPPIFTPKKHLGTPQFLVVLQPHCFPDAAVVAMLAFFVEQPPRDNNVVLVQRRIYL